MRAVAATAVVEMGAAMVEVETVVLAREAVRVAAVRAAAVWVAARAAVWEAVVRGVAARVAVRVEVRAS